MILDKEPDENTVYERQPGLTLQQEVDIGRIRQILLSTKDRKEEDPDPDPLQQYLEELTIERKNSDIEKGIDITDEEREKISTETRESAKKQYNENVEEIIRRYIKSTSNIEVETNFNGFKDKVNLAKSILRDRIINKIYNSENIHELTLDVRKLKETLTEISAAISMLLRWYRTPVGSARYKLGGIFIHDFNKPLASLISTLSLIPTDDDGIPRNIQIAQIEKLRSESPITKSYLFEVCLRTLTDNMDVLTEFFEDDINKTKPRFITFENIRKTIDLKKTKLTLTVNGQPFENHRFESVEQWISVHTLILNSLSAKAQNIKVEINLLENVTSIGIYDDAKILDDPFKKLQSDSEIVLKVEDTPPKKPEYKLMWPESYKKDITTNFNLGFKYPEFPTTQSLRGGGMVAFFKGQEVGKIVPDAQVQEMPMLMEQYIGFEDPVDVDGIQMKCFRVLFYNNK